MENDHGMTKAQYTKELRERRARKALAAMNRMQPTSETLSDMMEAGCSEGTIAEHTEQSLPYSDAQMTGVDVEVSDGPCETKRSALKRRAAASESARNRQRAGYVDGSHENKIAGANVTLLRSEEPEQQRPYYKEEDLMEMFESVLPSVEHYEKIEHPNHYNWHPSGVECIQIVREFSYNTGSAITYLWRAGRKPGSSAIEDMEKAIFHIQDEIDRLQKECENEETEHCTDSG